MLTIKFNELKTVIDDDDGDGDDNGKNICLNSQFNVMLFRCTVGFTSI